jgi:hypothetical protein
MIAANYPVRVLITVFLSVVAFTVISEAAPIVNSTIPAANASHVPPAKPGACFVNRSKRWV